MAGNRHYRGTATAVSRSVENRNIETSNFLMYRVHYICGGRFVLHPRASPYHCCAEYTSVFRIVIFNIKRSLHFGTEWCFLPGMLIHTERKASMCLQSTVSVNSIEYRRYTQYVRTIICGVLLLYTTNMYVLSPYGARDRSVSTRCLRIRYVHEFRFFVWLMSQAVRCGVFFCRGVLRYRG